MPKNRSCKEEVKEASLLDDCAGLGVAAKVVNCPLREWRLTLGRLGVDYWTEPLNFNQLRGKSIDGQ